MNRTERPRRRGRPVRAASRRCQFRKTETAAETPTGRLRYRQQGKANRQLLAQVKTPGRCVSDEAATLLGPVDVHPVKKVAPEKDHDDQDEPCHECEAGKIVHVLCRLRDAGERVRADHRQKHHLAKSDVEARQTENDEGYRRQPMRKSFKGLGRTFCAERPAVIRRRSMMR
jgi:hypothetical protein